MLASFVLWRKNYWTYFFCFFTPLWQQTEYLFLGKQKNLNKSVFVTIFHFTDQNNYLINQEDNQQMNSIIVSSPICRCRKYESYKESIFYNPMLHKYQHVLMCWVTCFCSSTVCRLSMHLGLFKSRFFKSSIKVWNAVMLCVNRSDIRL